MTTAANTFLPVRGYAQGFAVLAFVLVSMPAAAHGPLHERLELRSRTIAEQPRNAQALVERAELYLERRSFAEALADLARAERLRPTDAGIALTRARVLLAAGRAASAVESADTALARQPSLAEAWFVRGDALTRLGRNAAAAESYSLGLALVEQPTPERVLAQARALQAAGARHHLEAALRALDDGMARLGPIVTLQGEAISLEMALGHTDAALARLSTLAQGSARQESWLAQRGDILRAAGRDAQALEAYREAAHAIDALPPELRSVPATRELRAELQGRLVAMGTR